MRLLQVLLGQVAQGLRDFEWVSPALAPIRIDLEIEAAAIGVPAGGFKIFNSCNRETIEALGLSVPHVRRYRERS